MTKDYPEFAAFDLDYTVWPCYCDTHLFPPFSPVKKTNGEVLKVVDARGYELSIYKDIPKIITDLKDHGTKILSASRTWAPDVAQDLLKIYKIEYQGKLVSMSELFDAKRWGDRSKIGHIGEGIKEITGHDDIRKYKVFLFDDESRNRDVEKHGVTFVYVKDPEKGPTWDLYQDYLFGNNK